MNNYFARAGRYILRLAVLLIIMLALMTLAGMSRGYGLSSYLFIFASTRGWFFLAFILTVGLLYPLFSFTKTEIKCDISQKRESIVNAFANCNYAVETSEESKMTFRAKSFVRRLYYGFDDRITVVSDGQYITIEGLRRDIVRIEARLHVFMAM